MRMLLFIHTFVCVCVCVFVYVCTVIKYVYSVQIFVQVYSDKICVQLWANVFALCVCICVCVCVCLSLIIRVRYSRSPYMYNVYNCAFIPVLYAHAYGRHVSEKHVHMMNSHASSWIQTFLHMHIHIFMHMTFMHLLLSKYILHALFAHMIQT